MAQENLKAYAAEAKIVARIGYNRLMVEVERSGCSLAPINRELKLLKEIIDEIKDHPLKTWSDADNVLALIADTYTYIAVVQRHVACSAVCY